MLIPHLCSYCESIFMATQFHYFLFSGHYLYLSSDNTNVDLQEHKVRENTAPSPMSSEIGTGTKTANKLPVDDRFFIFHSLHIKKIGCQKLLSLTHTISNDSTASAKG